MDTFRHRIGCIMKKTNVLKSKYLLLLAILGTIWLCSPVPSDKESSDLFINVDEFTGNISKDFCKYGVPCIYPDTVHLRLIVLTYSRAKSLTILLNSLNDLVLDGDSASLEIWIDRNKEGKVNKAVLETAFAFSWKLGKKRVHVQSRHASIYGQWVDTWRPQNPLEVKGKEIALILEDDMVLSSQAYRWMRAVHDKFDGRADYAGCSLNGGAQMTAHNTGERICSKDPAFMYVCIGTWGFAPSPHFWAEFQDWYHANRSFSRSTVDTKMARASNEEENGSKKFVPLVPGTVPSGWYEGYEKSKGENTMWEMWFIYFANEKSAFTVYSNLVNDSMPEYECSSDGSNKLGFWQRFWRENKPDNRLCLSFNRQEAGLHFAEAADLNAPKCPMLDEWKRDYVNFPEILVKFDWMGNVVG